jgi:hypothetical protein
MARILERENWTQALSAFSRRNAGRGTWIEVEDPLIGALEGACGCRLLGVVHDPQVERVFIRLEDPETRPTVKYDLGGIQQIDVLTDEAGGETALRIAQEATQTLLRLEPTFARA